MALPESFVIKGIMAVHTADIATNKEELYINFPKTVNMENGEEMAFATGGINNIQISAKKHSKTATGSVETPNFNLAQIGMMIGSSVNVGAGLVRITEIKTITTNATITTHTAQGTAGSEIGFIQVLDANMNPTEELTQGAVIGAGVFTYTVGTKTITLNTSEVPDGTKVRISYNATTDATSKFISNSLTLFSANKKMYVDMIIEDLGGVEYLAQMYYPKASIDGTFSMSVDNAGDPPTFTMNWTGLAGMSNTGLWELREYDASLMV